MRNAPRLKQASAQRGFTMFEVSLAIGIATLALIAALPVQIEKLEQRQLEVSAAQIFTVGDIAILFRNNRGRWPGELAGVPCNINDAMVELIAEGFLINGITETAWGEPLVTSCTPVRFDVVTLAPAERRAQQAAEILHTAIVPPGSAEITAIFPAGGLPAFDQLLHRVEIPGRPELNQMQTNLNMGGLDIVNVGNISGDSANFENIDATTANFTSLTVEDSVGFETLTVQEDSSFCTAGTVGCTTSLSTNMQVSTEAVGTRMTLNGPLTIATADPAVDRVALNILGDLNLDGLAIARQGLRWGNNSELLDDEGGSITLGAGGTDPINPAAIGRPYIDFHYQGFREDYNVRVQNTDNLTLRVLGANSNAATLAVEGDVVVTNNMQVEGAIEARDVTSRLTRKSLAQAPYVMTIARPGELIAKPDYCDEFGMTPQIYTALNEFAEGPVATPIYQAQSFADDVGDNWRVRMRLVTQDNVLENPDPNFNRSLAITKCELLS